MAVYEKTTKQYRVVVGDTSRGATIYILNPAIARKFGTNCVFSYDGKTWIKTSGGRSLTLKDIATFVEGEDLQEIKKFFNMVAGEVA